MAHEDKERISEDRITGKVLGWRGSFGWIKPDGPVEHEKASLRGGRIFLHKTNMQDGTKRLKRGEPVEFVVYADSTGLGAEECISLGPPETKAQAEEGEEGEEAAEGAKLGKKARRKLKAAAAAEGKIGVIKTIGKKKGGKGEAITPVAKGAKKWLGKGAAGEGKIVAYSSQAGGKKGKGKGKGKKGESTGAIAAWVPPKAGAKGKAKGGAKGEGAKGKAVAKGAGKGKAGAKGARKGEPKGDVHQDSRQVLSKKRAAGVVRRMVGKFGWITPDEPVEHEVADQHGGDVFVHMNDVTEGSSLSKGDYVDFVLYIDEGGLGAMKVRLKEAAAAPAVEAASGKAGGKGKKGKGKGKGKASPVEVHSASVSKGGEKGKKGKGKGKDGKGAKAAGKGGAGKSAALGVQKTITKKGAEKGKGKAGKGGKGKKLPPFWEQHFSEEHGLHYYWNSKTKESMWEKPE